MGTAVILVIHVFLAAGIIGLVLLQRGKGADAGAGFGSGASGTVFGARGSSTVLSKTTAILATLFFVTSLTLAYLGGRTGPAAPDSLLERASKAQSAKPGTVTVPATKAGETPPTTAVPEQPLGSAPPAPEDPKDAAAPDNGAGKKP